MTHRSRVGELSKPLVFHSLFQLANTLVPLGLLWWAMARTTHLSWMLTWLLAAPAAGLMMRVFIFQHDCGHGSFFRSRSANDVLGLLLSVLTVTPYFYWRRTHALHHANFGKLEHRDELGYFMTLTVAEYQALSPRGRWLYRVYRNPVVFCGIGGAFQFLVKHRWPWDTPRSWKKEWLSIIFTNVGLLGGSVALAAYWGWGTVFRVHFPILVVTGWIGVWLFYIQHVFPDGYFSPAKQWDIRQASLEGSSYYALPPVLRWFSGDIGLHHVHHLHPLIPNYRLDEALHALPELRQVQPLTLRDSLRCWSLKLWDEEHGRLVGYPSAETSPAASPASA